MAAKRILMACALAMVFGSVGCRSWCEHHYPCAAPATACAPACQPCQQPVSYAPPPPTWNGAGAPSGAMSCTCVPQR